MTKSVQGINYILSYISICKSNIEKNMICNFLNIKFSEMYLMWSLRYKMKCLPSIQAALLLKKILF